MGRKKKKKTRHEEKLDEESEQSGMNTWERAAARELKSQSLDFRVGELHPKSPERYSKCDKWINWNPQERIRGEASSGSAATGIFKESEPIEDLDTPLNESEHKAG